MAVRAMALAGAIIALAAPMSSAQIVNGGLRARLPPSGGQPPAPTSQPTPQSTAPTHATSATADRTAPATKETSQTTAVRPPVTVRLVTTDYLRMHEPAAVANMVTLVRQGRLPTTVLNGLGSPELVKAAVGADWSDLTAARVVAAPTPSSGRMSPGGRAGSGAPPDVNGGPNAGASAVADVDEGAAATRLGQFLTIDAPPGIDLGQVQVGEHRRLVIPVVVLAAGTLSVTPAQGSLVHIQSLSLNTGLIDTTQGVGTVQRTADIDAAPWRIAVAAGQRVDVSMGFDPTTAEGFDGTGQAYKTSLDLKLDQSSLVLNRVNPTSTANLPERSVALQANVQGLLYGIGLTYPQPLYAVKGMQAMVFFDLGNAGDAGQATVTLKTDNLPPGITVAGPATQTFQLAAGQQLTGNAFVIAVAPQYIANEDETATILVTQKTPKGTQTATYVAPLAVIDASILGVYVYNWVDSGGNGAEVQSTFVLQSSGAWQWSGAVFNNGCTHVPYTITLPVGPDGFSQNGSAGDGSKIWGADPSAWSQVGFDPLLESAYDLIATTSSLQPSNVQMTCFTGLDF